MEGMDDTTMGETSYETPRKKFKTNDGRTLNAKKFFKELKKIEDTTSNRDADDSPEKIIANFENVIEREPQNIGNYKRFIKYYLEKTEIQKAINVAQRALSKLSSDDYEGRLSIWHLVLEVERTHGTDLNLQTAVRQSLVECNILDVCKHLENFVTPSKKEDLSKQYMTLLCENFKNDAYILKRAVESYFMQGDWKRAHQLIHMTIYLMDKDLRSELLTHFARISYKYGHMTMAISFFQDSIKMSPNLLDGWLYYAQMFAHEFQFDKAREVYLTAAKQKIPIGKMRVLLQNFLEFEKCYGDTADFRKAKFIANKFLKKL